MINCFSRSSSITGTHLKVLVMVVVRLGWKAGVEKEEVAHVECPFTLSGRGKGRGRRMCQELQSKATLEKYPVFFFLVPSLLKLYFFYLLPSNKYC